MIEITSEAQIFSLPLLAQVGDGGGDDPSSSPAAGGEAESKAAASLRYDRCCAPYLSPVAWTHDRPFWCSSEVSQASAAMGVPDDGATKVKLQRRSCAVLPRCRQLRLCLQDDLVAGTGAAVPHVPSEVEWKPTDVDGMTLDELKEREARKR